MGEQLAEVVVLPRPESEAGETRPDKRWRDFAMRETRLTLSELALIAGTRAALGAGLGLLLADRLPESQRKAIGWTLVLVGAVTTVPLVFEVLGGLTVPPKLEVGVGESI
jgi:hypothetical protein